MEDETAYEIPKNWCLSKIKDVCSVIMGQSPEGAAVSDDKNGADEIDYVIPGNDDAIRAVKLIAGAIANAVIEGRDGNDTAEEAATEEILC